MNDLDFCLEVVSRSRQPLLHSMLNSSETVSDRFGFKRLPIENDLWRIKRSDQTRDTGPIRLQHNILTQLEMLF